MNNLKKTSILFCIILMFTSCNKSANHISDRRLSDKELDVLNNLSEVNLTNKQYRKLSDDELDIGLNSDKLYNGKKYK